MADSWEAVRKLDEAENWAMRNEVVTKSSHNELMTIAKDVVHEVIENLPIDEESPQQSDAHVVEFTDNDFKYSPAQFDLDYLEGLKTEANADISALTRQSIYVKFDPLLSSHSSKSTTEKTPMLNVSLGHRGRDLLVLDSPPSSLNRVQMHDKDYYETSGFSPLSREAHSPPQGSDDGSSSPIPVTSCLVKELKYSDEDLNKLVSLAKRRARLKETEKMEAELSQLKEMVRAAKSQAKSHRDRVHVLGLKRLTHTSHMTLLNEERERYKLKIDERHKMIKEKLQELQEAKRDFDRYQSILANDKMQLETAFDKLHGRYVKLKESNVQLTESVKQTELYLTQLREWHQHASQVSNELTAATQELKEDFTQKCEALKREHETKLAVERARTKKLLLEREKLQDDLVDMEKDKQELTQICDDLMKQLESNAEM